MDPVEVELRLHLARQMACKGLAGKHVFWHWSIGSFESFHQKFFFHQMDTFWTPVYVQLTGTPLLQWKVERLARGLPKDGMAASCSLQEI